MAAQWYCHFNVEWACALLYWDSTHLPAHIARPAIALVQRPGGHCSRLGQSAREWTAAIDFAESRHSHLGKRRVCSQIWKGSTRGHHWVHDLCRTGRQGFVQCKLQFNSMFCVTSLTISLLLHRVTLVVPWSWRRAAATPRWASSPGALAAARVSIRASTRASLRCCHGSTRTSNESSICFSLRRDIETGGINSIKCTHNGFSLFAKDRQANAEKWNKEF